MHIKFELRWIYGSGSSEEVEETLFELLDSVRAEGSLTRAARSASVSYRHAWGLVRKWEERFRAPLLHMQRGRGRGAKLTELAERLVAARQALGREFSEKLDATAAELGAELDRFGESGRARVLRISASHCLGIAQLTELLRAEAGLDVVLQTRGSLESLRFLARSECVAAGFHMPLGPLRQAVLPAYARWLRGREYRLLLVGSRQQGLMTQPSNPKRINAIRDLTRRSVRFVNRQPESGTRIILDGLLELDGIDPERIRGYRTEEFTETAVAATVAGGAADAGFGIAAAAAMFKLRFVRLLEEEYFVALPADATELRAIVRRILQSAAFRQHMRQFPGYDTHESGRECRFEDLRPSA